MSDDKNIRHRFTVPAADTVVNDWIEQQSNLGFSLRTLIKAFVKSYGYQDATCFELGIPVKKRGRPPKQAQIQYGLMSDTVAGSAESGNESDNKSEVNEAASAVNSVSTASATNEHIQQADPLTAMMAAPVSKPAGGKVDETSTEIAEDDDGFIDPASLF